MKAPHWAPHAVAFVLAALLAAAAQVNPVLPVAMVVGSLFALWVFMSPFHLALMFCVVLFARPSELLPALESLSIPKLLALASIATFFLHRLFSRRIEATRSPFHPPMIALTSAVFLSTQLGTDRAASMTLFTDSFVKIIVVYVLLVHLVDRPSRVATTYVVMSITVACMAVYSMYAKATGLILVEGSRAAYVGALGDPNDFSLVLFMYVPFLIEGTMQTTGLRRIGLAILALTLVMGMAATQSRGGFMGVSLALAVMFHDRGSLKMRLAALPVGLLVIVLLVLLSGAGDRESGAVGSGEIDESAQGRLDAWIAGGRMLMRHPVLGVGFGSFALNYESYCLNPVIWGQHETHNSYIKVAAETGLAGFIPFMALVVFTLREAHRLRKYAQSEPNVIARAAMRAALPTACGFVLIAFFLSQSWSWYFYVMFGQVAAMGVLRTNAVGVRNAMPGASQSLVQRSTT